MSTASLNILVSHFPIAAAKLFHVVYDMLSLYSRAFVQYSLECSAGVIPHSLVTAQADLMLYWCRLSCFYLYVRGQKHGKHACQTTAIISTHL